MRVIRALAIGIVVVVISCAGMKDLASLSSSLGQRYHAQASVMVSNGTHLSITFQNVPNGAFAPESVASFAKAHYPGADSLEDITIAYAHVTQTGPLTVTRTDAPSTFLVRDLPEIPGTARTNER